MSNNNSPLLLVSQNVQGLQTIQNSSQGVSDYTLYSSNLNISKTYDRVGLMYTNTLLSTIPFFNESNNINKGNNMNNVKYRFFSTELINFIKSIGCKTLDLITCSINNSSLISEIIAVSNDLSITINYSIDKTGNVAEGGDWIMEESVINGNINNAVINIKPIYFNNTINSWNFLLDAMDLAPTVTVLNSKHIKRTLNADGISYTYKLTKNIYVNNKNNPVLTLNVGDIFDGNHHTITMKYDTIGILYCSGVIPDGVTATETVVKDLKVRCTNVSDVDDYDIYPAGGGIICATSSYFSVYNCSINIKNDINSYSGGICGSECGNINTLSKCFVKINGNINSDGGGICGSDCSNINTLSKCFVKINGNINNNGGGICGSECYTINTLSDCSAYIKGTVNERAGGICGLACGSINTLSKCSVKINGNIGTYAGGICGGNCGNINTLSKCSVKNNGNTNEYAGGICGFQNNYINNIINCKYIGKLSNRSGGILGGFYNGYNDANTSTNIANCTVISDIKNYSGGIVGYNFGYQNLDMYTNSLTISNCKVKGECDHTSSGILAPIVIGNASHGSGQVIITGCKYIKSIYDIYPTISQNYTITTSNNKKIHQE